MYCYRNTLLKEILLLQGKEKHNIFILCKPLTNWMVYKEVNQKRFLFMNDILLCKSHFNQFSRNMRFFLLKEFFNISKVKNNEQLRCMKNRFYEKNIFLWKKENIFWSYTSIGRFCLCLLRKFKSLFMTQFIAFN